MGNFKYSNCLLEAIKAKLKNPKNVKILYIPRGFNVGDTWGHFIWTDATIDTDNQYYFEFCSARNGSNHIWFKGRSALPNEQKFIECLTSLLLEIKS